MKQFEGKLALQQRVLPEYRAAFFDLLAQSCQGGLSVCAGQPLKEEAIAVTSALGAAQFQPVVNAYFLRGSFLLCQQRGLLDWLEAWQPEVLIAEANPRTLSTPVAVRWMKARQRRVLGWGLGAPAPASFQGVSRRWVEGGMKTLLKSTLRQFDGLITYSRRGAQEYAELGVAEEKIFLAPNATAPRPTHPMPVRSDKFDGRPVVLFVGRLQARKKVDALIEACSALPENLQPSLVIVGDGPERQALEALAGRVYARSEFTGARHGAELEALFCQADLFVLPGTGGLAVQQAMAWGLPVLMGQGDGTNDELVTSLNGWQLPELSALPEVLTLALRDVARLRAMGAESYRKVREEINLETMVAGFVAALSA